MAPFRLAALVLLSALAGSAAGEQLAIQGYTTAQGLAHDRVECIVQDSAGFLWFCTPEGLSRFDGYEFRTFGRESGLPSPTVHNLVEAGEGVYWVATAAGLCRFEAATSRCEPKTLGPPTDAPLVNALLKDSRGRIWAGNDDGLFRSESNGPDAAFRQVVLDRGQGLPGGAYAFFEAADGSVWVADVRTLWRILPDGRAMSFRLESIVWSIGADAQGRLWVGVRGGTLVLVPLLATALPPGELAPVDVSQAAPCGEGLPVLAPGSACTFMRSDLPRNSGRAFVASADGALWVGTQNQGLYGITGAGVRRFTVDHGLASDAILSLLEDRNGDLWVGTEGNGALRWTRRGLVSFGRRDGLSNTRIFSVFGGRGGDVFAVSGSSLLYRVAGRAVETVEPNVERFAGPFRFGARVAMEDSQGGWWFASREGLHRFARVRSLAELASARHPETLRDPERPQAALGPLFEDSRGDVWAGSSGQDDRGGLAVVRWERRTGTIHAYPVAAPATGSWVATSFAEDRSGALWMGAAQTGVLENVAREKAGLLRLRDGRFENVEPGGQGPHEVTALHVDRAGRLWFAAGRQGLGRIDEPTADRPTSVQYGREQGLSSEVVRTVTEDRWGRIYAGTNVGIDRLDPESGRLRHYGVADGLAAGQVDSAHCDPTGRLWFGTPAGLSTLSPDVEPPPAPLPVRILSLRVAGTPRALPGLGTLTLPGLELSAHDSPIEIGFASVGAAPGVKRLYRVRLEGADRDWGPPTESHQVNFARLPSGAYRFAVQAWSAEGANGPPTFVAFRILPPVWRRWWFLATASLLAALAAFAAFRYRLRMLLELERVRTRIATDLHDDIGSSLSRIAILSEVARRQGPANAAGSLASIADISRELVDSMSDIVWSVNPQRDTLLDLTQRMRALATEVFSALDIGLGFRAPAADASFAIAADLRRQVFLVFKEAVNNAATHAACRHVEVDLSVHAGGLTLRVADDGRGFTAGDGGGNGLASMAARARALGGDLEVASRPGEGTALTLRVPDPGGAGMLQRLGLTS